MADFSDKPIFVLALSFVVFFLVGALQGLASAMG
jgi:hypothetical protein